MSSPSTQSTNLTEDQLRRLYDDTAFQINREDTLVNYRLTWTLALNGFLFASFALLAKDITGSIKTYFEIAIPVTGFIVSAAGLGGVHAAHLQLNWLKAEWEKLGCFIWPRPYGGKNAFFLGRWPSYVPMITLTCVWAAFLGNLWIDRNADSTHFSPVGVTAELGRTSVWLHTASGTVKVCHSAPSASAPNVVCSANAK
jgi:hypothetical protein